MGREGFLLANNQAELLRIGCIAYGSLIIKDQICPHGWQIFQNNGAANKKE
jgi:hypothetical protein